MALTATLDKLTYNPGDTMTLTVTTAQGDRQQTGAVSGTVTVPGLGSAPYSATVAFPPKAVTVTDTSGVTWTMKSDDGTTAVYTATAPSS